VLTGATPTAAVWPTSAGIGLAVTGTTGLSVLSQCSEIGSLVPLELGLNLQKFLNRNFWRFLIFEFALRFHFCKIVGESRLMNGRSRLAVAEILARNFQSTACLSLVRMF